MKFKTYSKIQSLHKEECEGILVGKCYVQEKVDGANASIWLGDDKEIHYGSRSRDLFLAKDNFNGFGDWIKANHQELHKFFFNYPDTRLNGEWLVRHTIGYSELNYKKFYIFDIQEDDGSTWDIEFMYQVLSLYSFPKVELFAVLENPTLDQIKSFVGKSVLGQKGEGVVIKNLDFVNKFGNSQFGKLVSEEFKEDNAITFGGNNKTSETYTEMYYVNKFMTLGRVQKQFYKLESEKGRLDMKHIPEMMGRCYHDLITEEAWSVATEMAKSGKFFDFKAFKQLCDRKSKKIFIELLTGDVSVAHQ
jgi:ATP-dependent RNA circularization protein (DNA/RNA ligase family)